jgi:Domain of unknown function (DUF397)
MVRYLRGSLSDVDFSKDAVHMWIFDARARKKYYRSHGVAPADISQASWQKSHFSNLNGSCVEVSRLQSDRIGVRDTKDDGTGPVLVFTGPEWDAFLAGAKEGQFDNL